MHTVGVKASMGLALCLIVVLATAVGAEQLAKSGSGTIHSGWKGTGVTTPTGDKRMYWNGTFWGVSFNDAGKGFLHNVAWNCPALTDINNQMMNTKGSCALTDSEGDKIYGEWTGKGPVGGEFAGNVTMNGGTGKYTGIEGG